MKKFATSALILASAFTVNTSVNAEQIWSNFSLSYLKGNQYEVIEKDQQFMTVEYASGHNWGDTFLFVDRNKSKSGSISTYGEFAPRLSLGYLTDSDLSFGIVKDVFIASNWEMGDGFNNYMVGLGVSLDIKGFNYFTANVYQVNNDGAADSDQMLTLTFAYPFKLGDADFLYDGFLDWSTTSDTARSEMNFTSQLKYNLGGAFGTKSPIYVGVEYAYWNNKFGIAGIDERAASLLLKWHF